jgi:hypothetical protein
VIGGSRKNRCGSRPGLSLWRLAAVSRAHLVAAILGFRLRTSGTPLIHCSFLIMPSMQSTARMDVDQEVVAHDSDFLLSGFRSAANAMSRVTVHEDGALCRLELAGRLGGPWVAEAEHVWRSSLCTNKRIEVDVRQVRHRRNWAQAFIGHASGGSTLDRRGRRHDRSNRRNHRQAALAPSLFFRSIELFVNARGFKARILVVGTREENYHGFPARGDATRSSWPILSTFLPRVRSPKTHDGAGNAVTVS